MFSSLMIVRVSSFLSDLYKFRFAFAVELCLHLLKRKYLIYRCNEE